MVRILFTDTPSTDGRGAFQDPAHRSWWNENSFWYVTQAALRASIPGLTARFQVSHLRTWYPTPWHQDVHIPYVQANLLAVKDGPRLQRGRRGRRLNGANPRRYDSRVTGSPTAMSPGRSTVA